MTLTTILLAYPVKRAGTGIGTGLVPRFFPPFHTQIHTGAKKMLHELVWENYYHWICIFVVFTPTLVQTLSKCSKVDVCKCSTDEGTIDLWSLAGTPSNIPRFGYDLFLLDTDFRKILYSYEELQARSLEGT